MYVDVTRQLAEFAIDTRERDIPDAVREQAKIAITDSLGALLAGLSEPSVVLLQEQALTDLRDGPASVLGRSRRLSASGAAMANAAAAHALDYDNISVLIGFVSSPVLFALLAVAEAEGEVSGRELLTAFIVGWEAEAAIARGLGERGVYHYAKGWHSTSTLAHFGAAIAVSRLLKLNVEQTRQAIGIAASEASGLRTMIGNMVNAFHVGKAARNGVVAATLARRGFSAPLDAIEAKNGFCEAFNGPGMYDLPAMVATLGAPYDFLDPGVWIKAYPCCGLIHSGIDGTLDLRQEHAIGPDQVAHVRLAVHELVPPTMNVKYPETSYQAKFSAPFCIATALQNGSVKLEHFTEARVRDDALRRLMERIEMVVHPDLHGYETFLPPREFTDVRIELVDGRIVEGRTWRGSMRGMRMRPLTTSELKEKFVECCGSYCDPDAAGETFDVLRSLENVADVSEVIGRLR